MKKSNKLISVNKAINYLFRKKKAEKDTRSQLLNEIKEAFNELNALKNNYHYASEDMIDYYTYQILAVETKYRYLLRKLKKNDAV